jgi:hypothetical protein
LNPNNPGGPPGGYPPGGYPPGGGYPPAGGYPPGAYPQNPAPGYGPAPGAPQQPGMNPYGAPPGMPPGAPGMPYGAPPGMPPGAPGMPYGAPPGMPPGAPGMPYGAPPPGMPGMMPNMGMAARLGGAQASLKMAGGMLRTMQILFSVLGALMAVGGVVMIFTVDAGSGIGMILTGGIMAGTAWFMLPKFMGMVGGASSMVNALAAKEQLAMTGIPTTAQVLGMQMTGTMVNMNPQVMATLQVNGPQGPYQVQTTAIVPQMNIPQFQPGRVVNVRVNPQNPMDVAVVF